MQSMPFRSLDPFEDLYHPVDDGADFELGLTAQLEILNSPKSVLNSFVLSRDIINK